METWCYKERFFGGWRSFARSINEPCQRRWCLMKLYSFKNNLR